MTKSETSDSIGTKSKMCHLHVKRHPGQMLQWQSWQTSPSISMYSQPTPQPTVGSNQFFSQMMTIKKSLDKYPSQAPEVKPLISDDMPKLVTEKEQYPERRHSPDTLLVEACHGECSSILFFPNLALMSCLHNLGKFSRQRQTSRWSRKIYWSHMFNTSASQ